MLWRRVPESNRCTRICNPLHNHSANAPLNNAENITVEQPATQQTQAEKIPEN